MGPLFCIGMDLFILTKDFFTHLAAILETPLLDAELGTSDLVVGSDEEKTLVQAVKCSFLDAKLTLCTWHLEENLKRQLKTELACLNIIEINFGPDGLRSFDTSVSFAQKTSENESRFGEKVGSCLTEKLIPTISEHVFEISKTDERVIPINWKHNHCESIK